VIGDGPNLVAPPTDGCRLTLDFPISTAPLRVQFEFFLGGERLFLLSDPRSRSSVYYPVTPYPCCATAVYLSMLGRSCLGRIFAPH
jgi:hypothetical protein